MPQRIDGVSRILAVTSGKGGVGKTTVTVNLALALARGGARVGIFDADIYGPNVPLMLGVSRERPSEGWLPVGRSNNVPYIKPLERFGLLVMSMGLVVAERQAVIPDARFTGMIALRTLRDVLWGELDYLLLDLPPGTGEPQGTLLGAIGIDGAVVVTTPQAMSMLDAGRSLDLFRKAGVPLLGLIENMSYLVCPCCGEQIEMFERRERGWAVLEGDLPLLGRVPLDPLMSRTVTAAHPLAPAAEGAGETGEVESGARTSETEASRLFLGIARQLADRLRKEAA